MNRSSLLALAACVVLTIACERRGDRSAGERIADSADGHTAMAPEHLSTQSGFRTPESARYDAQRDVWFISNINGAPSDKDNNGFITRLSGDRTVMDTMFIASGENGVTLNAPKGLAIIGDTLWVADIDAVRGFDVSTGAPVATVDLARLGAVFLNDIAVGPDGSLYITDTGIRVRATGTTHPGPDRVFRVSGRTPVEVLRFPGAVGPDGIAYDAERGRFIIVAYASNAVYQWTVDATTADSIAAGPGAFDGVEVLADGRSLISSWTDSTVHVFEGGALRAFVRGMQSPADMGVDTTRGVLAIPLLELDSVEFWSIPPR
jgi:sugar lactone lactonase YvrE